MAELRVVPDPLILPAASKGEYAPEPFFGITPQIRFELYSIRKIFSCAGDNRYPIRNIVRG